MTPVANYTNITNWIYTKLQSFLTINSDYQDLANYDKGQFIGFPAITVVEDSFQNDFITLDANMIEYSFYIKVFGEISSDDSPTAYTKVRTLVDKITAYFKEISYTQDITGNETVKVAQSKFQTVLRETGPVRLGMIQIKLRFYDYL